MTSLFQVTDKTRLSIYIAAGIGFITASGLICIYKRYRDNYIPPKEWKKIGELTDLICYPVKSCGPVRVSSIYCSKLGLENNLMRDRIFMLVGTNGDFVTARQYPKLVLVQPSFHDNFMKLSAPGMIDVKIDIDRLKKLSPITTRVWGQPVKTVDCGEEVARWFSRYILAEDFGLRLMYYPLDYSTREVKGSLKKFSTMLKEDTGALHDATSFMLLNESSIADLNTRLQTPVSVYNFRPNFLVKGPAAFEEDNWKWIKIGEDVIFRCNKPCTRCIFTNVDPETAQRSPDGNPLKTLKGYRQFAKIGKDPVMGVHLGLRKSGTLSLGDLVYIGV
ncbi:mitochondrial amidoxime reducing component 2-like [Episyrphus balteatus]|uniref:mitochondrial amidoxime reducing component 2-like n=1 Tax=Episyrphus balteatus TaxID=286459 RepID=UPI002485B1D2|nr:mitochondrial amidoxime reducing component 2-like [Episyrphus balteatus]